VGLREVMYHPASMRTKCRVVVEGELITIEARTPKGYAEIWRSDSPHVVPPKPRQQEATV
jgi:hypothetical protein